MESGSNIDNFNKPYFNIAPHTIDLSNFGVDAAKRERYQSYESWFTAAKVTGMTAAIAVMLATFPIMLPMVLISSSKPLCVALRLYGSIGLCGFAAHGMWGEALRRKEMVELGVPVVGDCRAFTLTTMRNHDQDKVLRQGLLGTHALESFATANALWEELEKTKGEILQAIDDHKERVLENLIAEETATGFATFQTRHDAIVLQADADKRQAEADWAPASQWLENWYAKQLYVSHATELGDGPLETEASFIRGLQ